MVWNASFHAGFYLETLRTGEALAKMDSGISEATSPTRTCPVLSQVLFSNIEEILAVHRDFLSMVDSLLQPDPHAHHEIGRCFLHFVSYASPKCLSSLSTWLWLNLSCFAPRAPYASDDEATLSSYICGFRAHVYLCVFVKCNIFSMLFLEAQWNIIAFKA